MEGGTGRCLCGKVRFAFEGAPNWQAHCHCESCRRATASPFTSYFGVSHGRWHWTGTTPVAFVSSPGVKRHFCTTCGSPMAYEGDRWPHEIHFFAATLDDPAAFRPTAHVNWNEHLSWVRLADGLPVRHAPRRLTGAEDMGPILNLIREAFAYMDGIVDPPSSVHDLTGPSVSASPSASASRGWQGATGQIEGAVIERISWGGGDKGIGPGVAVPSPEVRLSRF